MYVIKTNIDTKSHKNNDDGDEKLIIFSTLVHSHTPLQ